MGDEVLRPLTEHDSDTAIMEFTRTSPSAETRKRPRRETDALLAYCSAGKRQADFVLVPRLLANDIVNAVAWIVGELGCLLSGPAATTEQAWRLQMAHDRILQLRKLASDNG